MGLFTDIVSTGLFGDKPAAWAGQQQANEENSAQAAITRDFNSEEAQKTRDFQTQMRSTQYQTATKDMIAAGLNPMLAYSQGGAGTPTGATASAGAPAQMGNKAIAASTASAQAAQIANLQASTEKLEADTQVSKALAVKTNAETNLVTNSATNMEQNTQNLKAQIQQITSNINLQKEQRLTEVQKQGLIAAQAGLTSVSQQLEKGKISLTEAQTKATQIMSTLNKLQIPKATNEANSQESWWMQNAAPYLNSAGKAADILGTGAYMLK